jgi:hypothetical protein
MTVGSTATAASLDISLHGHQPISINTMLSAAHTPSAKHASNQLQLPQSHNTAMDVVPLAALAQYI